MTTRTLDASVAVALLTNEAASASAEAALRFEELIAPHLLVHETTSALARKVMLGELSVGAAEDALDAMDVLPVTVIDELPFARAAFHLSLELEHPVYDCFYLALAIAFDAPVLTADHALASRCAEAGYGDRVELIG